MNAFGFYSKDLIDGYYYQCVIDVSTLMCHFYVFKEDDRIRMYVFKIEGFDSY